MRVTSLVTLAAMLVVGGSLAPAALDRLLGRPLAAGHHPAVAEPRVPPSNANVERQPAAESAVQHFAPNVGPAIKGEFSLHLEARPYGEHSGEALRHAVALYSRHRSYEADKILESALASANSAQADPFALVQLLAARQRQVSYLDWLADNLGESLRNLSPDSLPPAIVSDAYAFVIDAAWSSNRDTAQQLWELATSRHPESAELLLAGARLMMDDPASRDRALSVAQDAVQILGRPYGDLSTWPAQPRLEAAVAQFVLINTAAGQSSRAKAYIDWLSANDSDYLELVRAVAP